MSAPLEPEALPPSISSVVGSPAKMSAQQARALASAVIEAASGTSSCESFGSCGPESLLWRTLPQELLAGLMRCEVTWQGVTMTAYRSRCRRLIAELGISGSGCSSLLFATPQAHDTAPGDPARVGRFGTKHGGRNLNDEVALMESLTRDGLLPTPLADDTGQRKERYAQGGLPLSMAAGLLPTPRVSRGADCPSERARKSPSLEATVNMLPTPRATGYKDCGTEDPERMQSIQAVTGDTGPLNPPWVEWLCGFPIGWTDCELSETA